MDPANPRALPHRAAEFKAAPHIRLRTVALILGLAAVAFVVVAAISLRAALEERQRTLDDLDRSAYMLSQRIDAEVAGRLSLLAGLSSSPSLHNDDLAAFDRQLKETETPSYTWMTMFDDERVVLHTAFPFGTPLPTISSFNPHPDDFSTLRREGTYVSRRFRAQMLDLSAVTVNLAAQPTRSGVRYYLNSVLTDQRFAELMKAQRFDPRFDVIVIDQANQAIVDMMRGELVAGEMVSPAVLAALDQKGETANDIGRAHIDDRGRKRILAYCGTSNTRWHIVVSIDRVVLDAPLYRLAIWLLLCCLTIVGLSVLAIKLARQDLGAAEEAVNDVQRDIVELSLQLQRSQDTERQRIAREMHDTTVQHLAGAMLHLQGSATSDLTIKEARLAIAKAIEELRTFSFALMPQELNGRGLSCAVTHFTEAMYERAGLRVRLAIDPETDKLPLDVQQALFRILQEAFTNVLRHANACEVTVTVRCEDDSMVLVVEDRGAPRPARPPEWFTERSGVGLAAMRSRLAPFGGTLSIAGHPEGTRLEARILITP